MPPRKKSKVSKSKETGVRNNAGGKGVDGRRRHLDDLPVELHLEIIRCLHPRDLLSIAKTCKKLRALTLQRDSESIWKAAWARAGDLPDCPTFVSEPALIHLLTSSCCQECGHRGVRRQILTWCRMYCAKCLTKLSYCYTDVEDKLHELDKRILGERRDHEDICVMFNRHISSQGNARRRDYMRFPRSQVDAFVAEYHALAQPVTNELLRELVDRQKADAGLRCRHQLRYLKWEEEQEIIQKAEVEAKRKKLFEEILVRLKKEAKGSEIESLSKQELDEMSYLPIVSHAAKLKKPDWGKVLKAMHQFIEHKHKQREEDERAKVLEARFEDLDNAILVQYMKLPRKVHMEFRPQVIDLAFIKDIKDIVDAPASETVTYDSFKQVMPSVAAQWRQQCKEEVEKWLMPTIANYTMNIEPLKLAIAVLVCEGGCLAWETDKIRILHYPEVLGHKCLRKSPPGGWHRDFLPDDVYSRTAVHYGSDPEEIYPETFGPFNVAHFVPEDVDENVAKMVRIVDALGLNSTRATVQELKACDRRLRCKKCVLGAPDKDYVYTWEAALNHSIRSHPKHRGPGHDELGFLLGKNEDVDPDFDSKDDEWELVNEDEMGAVRELEAVAHAPKMGVESWWACARCPIFHDWGEGIKKHLLQKHNIEFSEECLRDGTLFLHPEESAPSALIRPPVLLPPRRSG
ncbi:hypothetical protein L226DRAFT_371912 [Lentinus tigrinus ALCF2SS1-7]|uniref:uncharacterized protein n=1 Tax=Lentinus tigrinus ALCF2SS1-7 TaxID=1328758 RepID=UPI001166160D|nr:hypothetical protein L226DRAFT_371912 [Lentinus tigrinus ALCF2SS1-7]